MKFTITEFKTACKENGVDPTPIIASLKKGRETAEKRPFWTLFVDTLVKFHEEVKKTAYHLISRDFKILEEIYDLLKKVCISRGFEWTEEKCCNGFRKYLERAWNKDQWLRNNFTLNNILIQFNSIINATKTPSGNNDYANRLTQRIAG